MGITSVPSAVTGQTYSAANYNTQVRDNINGIWVATAAGDLIYASGASSAARLAKPASIGLLQNGSPGVPSWLTGGSALQVLRKNAANTGFEFAEPANLHTKGMVSSIVEGTTSSTFPVDVPYMTLDLVLTSTCTVVVFGVGSAAVSSSTIYAGYISAVIDGVSMIADNSLPHTFMGQYAPISVMWYRTGILAGTRNVKLQMMIQNASRVMYWGGGYLIALAFKE